MPIVPLSLSDRFPGALLGAALGEILGANYQHRLNLQLPCVWLEVDQWGFDYLPGANQPAWGQLAIEQAKALIQSGQNLSSFPGEHLTAVSSNNWMGLTIASLPMMLFYHDNWQQLQATVQENLLNSCYPSSLSTAVLVIGYTLSLTLRNQLHLPGLVPQLIAALDLHNALPPLAQQLDQVQAWHQEKTGLSAAHSLITPSASTAIEPTFVAIAIHSLLQTPQSFRVSLLRTAQLNYQPQVACAITGALLGAYNGIAALPFAWRRRLQSAADRSSALTSFWQASSEAELLQYADLLLATWSGVCDLSLSTQSSQTPVTASPGIVRPR